jgi:hypothetical protein
MRRVPRESLAHPHQLAVADVHRVPAGAILAWHLSDLRRHPEPAEGTHDEARQGFESLGDALLRLRVRHGPRERQGALVEDGGAASGQAFHGVIAHGARGRCGRAVPGRKRVPLAEGHHPARPVEAKRLGNDAVGRVDEQGAGERDVEPRRSRKAAAEDLERAIGHGG